MASPESTDGLNLEERLEPGYLLALIAADAGSIVTKGAVLDPREFTQRSQIPDSPGSIEHTD